MPPYIPLYDCEFTRVCMAYLQLRGTYFTGSSAVVKKL